MAINFPDSPSVNDTHTVGSRTWKWDGTVWNLVVSQQISDHGNLQGLADDDHTQYLLADGTRAATELTVGGDLTVDTDTLYVDSANDRVGVGTASPAVALDVVGTTDTDYLTVGGENVTPYTGRKNAIINGNMSIAQRYTSNTHGSGGGTSYWYCDRWRVHNYNWTAGSDVTTSQSTDAPDGFQYSAKWANGATALTFGTGGSQFMQQKIEGYNAMHLYDSDYVTVSFWVKSSTAGTYTLQMENGSTRVIHKEYSVSSANTWEHKSLTIPMSTGTASGTWDTTIGVGINLTWYFGAASDRIGDDYINTWGTRGNYHYLTTNSVNLATIANSSFYMTGVQLEVGDKATPFEHRSVGEELAACQRYYFSRGGMSVAGHIGADTYANTGGVFFPVKMRAVPSVSFQRSGTVGQMYVTYGSSGYGNQTGWNASSISTDGVGRFYRYFGNSAGAAMIGSFDGLTAEAEL